MRKMIVAVLIVGVLMLGTFAIIEKTSEGFFFCKNTDFQDSREVKGCESLEGEYPTPDGGHQGGGGDVPG
jgi:hypothetical protein